VATLEAVEKIMRRIKHIKLNERKNSHDIFEIKIEERQQQHQLPKAIANLVLSRHQEKSCAEINVVMITFILMVAFCI